MNKTILITGSSSGIGKATAKYFQKKGWNVIATMRKPESESELNKLDNILVTRLDVQDSDSIQSAVQEGIERFGQIDVLLNNAGFGCMGILEATPIESIKRQFDVNVIGLLESTKAVIPHFRENGSGTIVNVSSVAGKVTFPMGGFYNATKHAIEALTESLYYEMEEIGVKVKIIEPGAIETDFGQSLDLNNDESLKEYQSFVNTLLSSMMNMSKGALPAVEVAKVIFNAVTDSTDQLRYVVGQDAEELIKLRESLSDTELIATFKQQFGLVNTTTKEAVS